MKKTTRSDDKGIMEYLGRLFDGRENGPIDDETSRQITLEMARQLRLHRLDQITGIDSGDTFRKTPRRFLQSARNTIRRTADLPQDDQMQEFPPKYSECVSQARPDTSEPASLQGTLKKPCSSVNLPNCRQNSKTAASGREFQNDINSDVPNDIVASKVAEVDDHESPSDNIGQMTWSLDDSDLLYDHVGINQETNTRIPLEANCPAFNVSSDGDNRTDQLQNVVLKIEEENSSDAGHQNEQLEESATVLESLMSIDDESTTPKAMKSSDIRNAFGSGTNSETQSALNIHPPSLREFNLILGAALGTLIAASLIGSPPTVRPRRSRNDENQYLIDDDQSIHSPHRNRNDDQEEDCRNNP